MHRDWGTGFQAEKPALSDWALHAGYGAPAAGVSEAIKPATAAPPGEVVGSWDVKERNMMASPRSSQSSAVHYLMWSDSEAQRDGWLFQIIQETESWRLEWCQWFVWAPSRLLSFPASFILLKSHHFPLRERTWLCLSFCCTQDHQRQGSNTHQRLGLTANGK